MNTQINDRLLQTLVDSIKKYKLLMVKQGNSSLKIRSSLLTILQTSEPSNSTTSLSTSDNDLLLISIKQALSKFSTLNKALTHFLVNIQVQIARLTEEEQDEPLIKIQEKRQTKENVDRPKKKSQKEKANKKKSKSGKGVLEEVRQKAMANLQCQKYEIQQNIQEISMLKDLLEHKILNDLCSQAIFNRNSIFVLSN